MDEGLEPIRAGRRVWVGLGLGAARVKTGEAGIDPVFPALYVSDVTWMLKVSGSFSNSTLPTSS